MGPRNWCDRINNIFVSACIIEVVASLGCMLSDLIGYMKFLCLFLIFLSLDHHFWPGLGNASSYEPGYLLSNT